MRFAFLAVFPLLLPAASAILNCTAGAVARDGLLLVNFRSASVEGWKITQATLMVHVKDGKAPATLRVSTVPRPWSEDDPQPGAASAFRKPARFGDFKATNAGQGWISVALDPALVEAMAAGASHGLAIAAAGARIDGPRPAFTQPYLTAVSR